MVRPHCTDHAEMVQREFADHLKCGQLAPLNGFTRCDLAGRLWRYPAALPMRPASANVCKRASYAIPSRRGAWIHAQFVHTLFRQT